MDCVINIKLFANFIKRNFLDRQNLSAYLEMQDAGAFANPS